MHHLKLSHTPGGKGPWDGHFGRQVTVPCKVKTLGHRTHTTWGRWLHPHTFSKTQNCKLKSVHFILTKFYRCKRKIESKMNKMNIRKQFAGVLLGPSGSACARGWVGLAAREETKPRRRPARAETGRPPPPPPDCSFDFSLAVLVSMQLRLSVLGAFLGQSLPARGAFLGAERRERSAGEARTSRGAEPPA